MSNFSFSLNVYNYLTILYFKLSRKCDNVKLQHFQIWVFIFCKLSHFSYYMLFFNINCVFPHTKCLLRTTSTVLINESIIVEQIILSANCFKSSISVNMFPHAGRAKRRSEHEHSIPFPQTPNLQKNTLTKIEKNGNSR